MRKLIFLGAMAVMLTSCSYHSLRGENGNVYTVVNQSDMPESKSFETPKSVEIPMTVGPVVGIPNATAFRMTGDYENNVAITLNANGELIYYPDPIDITADSEPLALGNGWWLNRQGLGANSVFTTYTFAEYAALPAVPTPQQLKNSIIPGAKVTDLIVLPVKLNSAESNLPLIKEYLDGK